MRLTKASDYALRLMTSLAMVERDAIVSIREMAMRTDVPRSFLANIAQKLSAAGLIDSSKGARGGLKLKRKPDEITALDIIEAIEGPLEFSTCQSMDGCRHEDYCSVRPLMETLREQVAETLGSTTLSMLVEQGSGQFWGAFSLMDSSSGS